MEKLKELYSSDGIYGSLTYGSPFVSKGLLCAAYCVQVDLVKSKKVLCVGAGNGYEVVLFLKGGYDVTSLEMYHPNIRILKGRQVKGYAQDLPFKDKEFDLYFCCEMMEHVPEELIVPILKEAKRVSNEIFFSIATKNDPPHNTHINIHELPFWYNMFTDLGFNLKSIQHAGGLPIMTPHGLTIATWKNGVILNAEC